MKNKTIFLIFIALFVIVYQCWPKDSLELRMQKIIDKGISKHDIRGASVAIIFPDEKIWIGTSGISHDTVSMKSDMLFAIGSITKNVVAALTLKLVEEKMLSLEDPISKWLPAYRYVDGNITIRQLLNHTSGLYMFWDNQQIWDDLKKDRAKIWTPEEILSYIKEPYFEVGRGFRYSNTNYLLCAMIIEKATNSKLSTEIKKRLWKPLDINAYLSIQEEIPNNQAHVYGDNFNFGEKEKDLTYLPRASHESIAFGSSGIFTSAEGLARWSHALFEGKVLHQQSMDEMLKFIKFKPFANMRGYGLGVQQYTKDFSSGKQAIGHGGGNIGTTTYMVYLPKYHVSLVVMINAFPNKGADVITKGLIRVILRDFKAVGIIPYFNFFPYGYIGICSISIWIAVIIFHIRKKKRLLDNQSLLNRLRST